MKQVKKKPITENTVIVIKIHWGDSIAELRWQRKEQWTWSRLTEIINLNNGENKKLKKINIVSGTY